MVLCTRARETGVRSLALAVTTVLLTTSCSLAGGGDDAERGSGQPSDPASASPSDGASSTAPSEDAAAGEVVLVTHESFVLPDDLVARFEETSGLELSVRAAGDAGTLTNKLVLTQGNPTGDVAFGVDNTFASRAIEEGVFASYAPTLPEGAEAHELPSDQDDLLTPVDHASVCVNVDDTWFAEQGVEPPTTLEDLTDPTYRGLFVAPGATTSSPGMAFLLATIAEFGEAWPAYWADLMANDTKLTDGWSDAYQGEFTQGGGKGERPIVVSYDTSPAFTVDGKGGTTTSALLDTCFRQVEYAGVLAGAENPEGAQQLVDFLVSEEVQAALPESMYVFPVSSGVELPADWAKFAEQPDDPYQVDPETIAQSRDEWLQQWTEVVTR